VEGEVAYHPCALNRCRDVSLVSHVGNPFEVLPGPAELAVFNIEANDYRLVALVRYENGVMRILFFGSHEEYARIDAEKV